MTKFYSLSQENASMLNDVILNNQTNYSGKRFIDLYNFMAEMSNQKPVSDFHSKQSAVLKIKNLYRLFMVADEALKVQKESEENPVIVKSNHEPRAEKVTRHVDSIKKTVKRALMLMVKIDCEEYTELKFVSSKAGDYPKGCTIVPSKPLTEAQTRWLKGLKRDITIIN